MLFTHNDRHVIPAETGHASWSFNIDSHMLCLGEMEHVRPALFSLLDLLVL